ncbi:hypothetical protein [Nocardia huaxiensis]|uniref:Uncharacterized protein n=1 Tax=Nocardia huaxiensis TaxID=2755382 RepID=A0A7D6ZEG8_9NOCA|nr:hypothetical protein [Nocardia huaxiensis]QLY28267.1 hypothetical protein H0264_23080 [Nocardia huaxiensis]UFS98296.1 hypothetical protein LPY97_10560 [Nocardia huaxiensis]
MSPGNGRPEDLWSQVTDVFEPIADDYEPPRAGRAPARGRSQGQRYALIGLVVAVVLALGVGAFLTARHFIGPVDPETTARQTVTETTTPAAVTTTPSGPTTPPAAGAALSSVLAWIKAGTPVDAANFHTATSGNTVNDLGSAVAFTSPSGKIRCMTPTAGTSVRQGLTCMADLDNPPSRPANARGNWVPGWIDFPGATLGVGHVQGDPGPFLLGDGPTLNYGSRLTFDNYDCRMDKAGLFCLNQSESSAMQLSSAGPTPFGCLSEYTSTEYGLWYSCNTPVPTTTTKSTRSEQPTTTAVAAVVGQPCTKEGQRGRAANGTALICEAAGGSGLRWFVE